MKVLSIRQPFAWLIVTGQKRIETRTWRTLYRGPLLIHASSRPFPDYERILPNLTLPAPDELVLSAIIGRANLVDVRRVESIRRTLTAFERQVGDYTAGRFGWVLEQPVHFRVPIPARGRLGLWEHP